MAKRTRSHILEDESRNQLQAIIPSEWVVRDKPKDYGIDCEIEIFDSKGNPTGAIFWVQLKATDSKKTGLGLSLKKEKLKQFNSYPIPVLFLRYSSPLESFFYEWSNKYYFLGVNSSSKSISLKFNKEWDGTTPTDIQSYLKKVNLIKRGDFELPLRCSIVNYTSSVSIAYAIKSSFENYNDCIRFDNEGYLFEMTIYDNKMLITLMNEFAAFFYISEASFNADTLSKSIGCGILVILAQIKKYDLLNILFDRLDLKKYLSKNVEILKFLIPHLFNGENENMNFIHQCMDEIDDPALEVLTNITLQTNRNKASKKTRDNIISFYQKLLDSPKRNSTAKSTYLYNIGNIYTSRGDYLKALSFYNKARKYNPKYLEYDYFLAELAGVLFESEKYDLSKKLYKKSLEINDSEYLRYALYGDALMFTGEYSEAVKNFNIYLINSDEASSEYQLKFTALTTLISTGYPKSQKRNTLESSKLIGERENTSLENLKEAVERDLLCKYAWYELGHRYLEQDKLKDAFISFLMSSVLYRYINAPWINCTTLSLQIKETDILYYHVINCSYKFCGDGYISELMDYIQSLNLDFGEQILEEIEKAIQPINQPKREFRLIDNIGEVITVFI